MHELVDGLTNKTVLTGVSDNVAKGWKLVIEGVSKFINIIEILTEGGAEEVDIE